MRKCSQAGFTLIEVVLSLALAGLILVAMNTFIFSMGELWGKNTDQRLFDQHVDAVTRFLSNTFREATLPPEARAKATPVSVQQITPQNGAADKLLTFDLLHGSRILVWPDAPLPEVTCSLQLRPNDGLYFLWQSRLETSYTAYPPPSGSPSRELLLTPLITQVQYDYYDATFKKWTTVDTMNNDQNGNPQAPQRLRLTFKYGRLKRVSTVPIPATPQGMPNFTW